MKHIKKFESNYEEYPEIWKGDYVVCKSRYYSSIFDYNIGKVIRIMEGPTHFYTYVVEIGTANEYQNYSRDEILLHSHDLEYLKKNKEILLSADKFNI